MDPWDFRQQVMLGGGNAPILGPFDPATGQRSTTATSPEDFRQQVSMGGGYAPILGNFDPTRQQTAASIPSTSSTFSSSYPTTTAAPAASSSRSYGYIPRTSTGRRNRYAEIMSQYEQAQPYSFTSMPSSYTGGYDATAYTPAAAPSNRYADIIAQSVPLLGAAGGGRGVPEAPSAWSQMTPAERAAYYAANPTEGKIALGIQDLFGNATILGNAARYFGKDGWYDSRLEKMGVNPTISLENQNTLAGNAWQRALDSQSQSAAMQAAIAAADAQGGFTANPMSSDPAQQAAAIRQAEADSAAARASEAAAAQAAAAAQTAAQGNTSNEGRGGGGGGYSGAPSGGSDVGRSAPGSAHYAKGGHVSMMHLQGPNPMGPDDGYGALKDGEYVINDKAVKKYGIELMDAINSGKISKGKLRGLLEM